MNTLTNFANVCQDGAMPTNDTPEIEQLRHWQTQGKEAYEAGSVRIVPRDILVNQGVEAAKSWYRGWDAANLAAPWDDER